MISKRFAGILVLIIALVMFSGCASMETRVEQTVSGPQVKIGSYNIDISDEYKYLGNMPTSEMGKTDIYGDANVKIENHVFVKGVSVSEGILVQVLSLHPQWNYLTEVDFNYLIREGVVQHGRKNKSTEEN